MPENLITPAAVGSAIRQRRQQLDLTQEQLCERMGFPGKRVSYISAVENGNQSDLKVSRLALFAEALGFSVSDLLLLASNKSTA